MRHLTQKFSWARCLTTAWIALIVAAPVRAEGDDIGAVLAHVRLQYEEKVQAIRDEVLEKIGIKQAALRAKSKPKLEEIAELETARTAFTTSGQWPTFRKFNDCQTKLRKAAKSLDEAYAKAETDYLKSGHDAAASSIRAEHEHFLKECDINSWSDNVVAHWNDEQRVIGSARRNIDVGEFTAEAYRLELIAQGMDGDGSLTLEIPISGKKRITLATLPAAGKVVHILLSIRESFVSADVGVARPVSGSMREDDTPRTLVLWSDKGKLELKSVRFKPVLTAADGDIATALAGDSRQATVVAADDGAADVPLPKSSKWRGYRWHGQNPQDLKGSVITDATVLHSENGRVELQSDGWGSCGSQLWIFQLRGSRLKLVEIHTRCLDEFTEVKGEGTVDGEKLHFRASARVAGHSINAIVYSRFELRRVMEE